MMLFRCVACRHVFTEDELHRSMCHRNPSETTPWIYGPHECDPLEVPPGAAPRTMRTAMNDDLIKALASKNAPLYHSNAVFSHAVDQLAAMLPAMVDGLAAEARRAESDHTVAVRQMMSERLRDPIPIEGLDPSVIQQAADAADTGGRVTGDSREPTDAMVDALAAVLREHGDLQPPSARVADYVHDGLSAQERADAIAALNVEDERLEQLQRDRVRRGLREAMRHAWTDGLVAERDRLRSTLIEVLNVLWQDTHRKGRPGKQSGFVPVEQFQRWSDVLNDVTQAPSSGQLP